MLIFGSEGLTEFVTVIQEPAESDEDPFDVGSNLSVNGTANCYVVTKAGDYTFDASVMGNGEKGVLWEESQLDGLHLWPKQIEHVSFNNAYWDRNKKPNKVFVIWDDNNVVSDVTFSPSKMVVSFKATGNKGNTDTSYWTATSGRRAPIPRTARPPTACSTSSAVRTL